MGYLLLTGRYRWDISSGMAARRPARKGFLIRLNDAERGAVEAGAAQAGMLLAPWARWTLLEAVGYRARSRPSTLIDGAVTLEPSKDDAAPATRGVVDLQAAHSGPLAVALRCSRHKRLACQTCGP